MYNRAPSPLSTRLLRIGVFLFLGTSTSLAACNAEELDGGSRRVVFIRSALAPPAAAGPSGACAYTPDLNAPALFTGTADLGVRDDYRLTVLVQSVDKTVATSISDAHVTVTETDGTLIREFTQTTAGFVEAGGYGLASFIGIDAPTRDLLLGSVPTRQVTHTVVVHVELTGTDPATGSSAGSPEFQFPVKVCNGCLVSFATGNDPGSSVQPNCLKPVASDIHLPCATGQDEQVPCELCVGARPACDPLTP
jgi:hypothetical protein